MCTISMPADYEMLVSHSPPVFSHSPPISYLHNYPSYRRCDGPFGMRPLPPPLGAFRTSAPPIIPLHSEKEAPMSPRRPCLVLRTEESLGGDDTDPTSPTRLKKKVVFADDRGIPLTQVRVMSEPSGVPPLWTSKFLLQVTKGLTAEAVPEPWEITFAQPASDYVTFRKTLDTENVSLENVIVKESDDCVVGTIKVRNIAFHKEVIVRSSSDEWLTHEDTFCKFVNNHPVMPPSIGHYVLYDTFQFRLTLPPRSRKIEFCVCFRCDGNEFWDNNSGKNYVLVKKVMPAPKSQSEEEKNDRNNDADRVDLPLKCVDALQAKLESWSEFASWMHLENNTPYW